MKQVIPEYNEPVVLSIRDMWDEYNDSEEPIIAYVTAGGTGMAILSEVRHGGAGFRYHKDLVLERSTKTTYLGANKTAAIKLALKAGRKVLLFTDFDEFARYAAERTKL